MHDRQNSPTSLIHALLVEAFFSMASPEVSTYFGVEAILDRVLANHTLNELLDDLRARPQALQWSMSQSTPHPLGFDKIILARAHGYTLRCHIWKPSDGHGHIHNHAAPFASWILSGGYLEKRFQTVDSSSEASGESHQFWRFAYPSGFGLEMSQPVSKGQVFLREAAEIQRKQGDQFVVPHNELHMTEKIVTEVPTISLLVQAPIQTQWTDVYVKSSVLEGHQKAQQFTQESFMRSLDLIRDALK